MSQTGADAAGATFVGFIFLFYGLIILLSIASFVFWIVEIVDVARREFPEPNTKIIWLLVVVILHGLGALIYYFAGKPHGWLPGQRPTSPYLSPPQDSSPSVWPPPPNPPA